jgi:hypothetical protein
MSNNKIPTTWTDEQLQYQLDEWATVIKQGGIPDMTLRGALDFETKLLHYTLDFGLKRIPLSKNQAEHVIIWRDKHYEQCERNRLSSELRNTHFAGFAKSVVDELLSLEALSDLEMIVSDWEDRGLAPMRDIIARRAFDLMLHAIGNLDGSVLDLSASNEQVVQEIPDLPVLPEEKR